MYFQIAKLGEGEALYGCLGAGMTTFGTGRRREERQGTRPKPSVLTIKAGIWFCFKRIVLATPPSIKDSEGDPREAAARLAQTLRSAKGD